MIKYLVIIMVLFSSCYSSLEQSVENKLEYTTANIQQMRKDTVIISIKDNNSGIYVFETDNIVKWELDAIDKYAVPINIYLLVILIGISLGSIISLIGTLKK